MIVPWSDAHVRQIKAMYDAGKPVPAPELQIGDVVRHRNTGDVVEVFDVVKHRAGTISRIRAQRLSDRAEVECLNIELVRVTPLELLGEQAGG